MKWSAALPRPRPRARPSPATSYATSPRQAAGAALRARRAPVGRHERRPATGQARRRGSAARLLGAWRHDGRQLGLEAPVHDAVQGARLAWLGLGAGLDAAGLGAGRGGRCARAARSLGRAQRPRRELVETPLKAVHTRPLRRGLRHGRCFAVCWPGAAPAAKVAPAPGDLACSWRSGGRLPRRRRADARAGGLCGRGTATNSSRPPTSSCEIRDAPENAALRNRRTELALGCTAEVTTPTDRGRGDLCCRVVVAGLRRAAAAHLGAGAGGGRRRRAAACALCCCLAASSASGKQSPRPSSSGD
jgi:hypothetical protein